MISVQTAVVIVAVVAAAVYVVRTWMARKSARGCGSCPANTNRRDDYV